MIGGDLVELSPTGIVKNNQEPKNLVMFQES